MSYGLEIHILFKQFPPSFAFDAEYCPWRIWNTNYWSSPRNLGCSGKKSIEKTFSKGGDDFQPNSPWGHVIEVTFCQPMSLSQPQKLTLTSLSPEFIPFLLFNYFLPLRTDLKWLSLPVNICWSQCRSTKRKRMSSSSLNLYLSLTFHAAPEVCMACAS